MKRNRRTALILTLVMMMLFTACSAARDEVAYSQGTKTHERDTAQDYSNSTSIAEAGAMGESYLSIEENKEKLTADERLVTFSLKVDTSSYTNVKRYIESGMQPPADAVKTEEMLNYFSYEEEMQMGEAPFAVSAEIGQSPFDETKLTALVRVKTEEIEKEHMPDSNLVFLIDTSGSMDAYDKLPLLKEAFRLLVESMGENDRVSIVTYAGSSHIVLDGASGAEKDRILDAIRSLEPGGSTAGADGIHTAYQLAEKNFRKDGSNRIILATDGDFNVGISDLDALEDFISDKRESNVYLSILGFGTGNLQDDIMETLSKNGNGNYSYIESLDTAKKVLIDELGSNLFTVADDVKAQVEFNPQRVKSHRLIGYENRLLSNEDFEDDSKDAGEIGAGTDVVAMFELELFDDNDESGLKYTQTEDEQTDDYNEELFELRIRYKDHGENESKLVTLPVALTEKKATESLSDDFRFACAVATFSGLLRNSEYYTDVDLTRIYELAERSLGMDADGYRQNFLEMLKAYQPISQQSNSAIEDKGIAD